MTSVFHYWLQMGLSKIYIQQSLEKICTYSPQSQSSIATDYFQRGLYFSPLCALTTPMIVVISASDRQTYRYNHKRHASILQCRIRKTTTVQQWHKHWKERGNEDKTDWNTVRHHGDRRLWLGQKKLPLVHQSDHQQYYGSLIKYLSQYHFYQKY